MFLFVWKFSHCVHHSSWFAWFKGCCVQAGGRWEEKKEWLRLGNFWRCLQLWNVPRQCLPPSLLRQGLAGVCWGLVRSSVTKPSSTFPSADRKGPEQNRGSFYTFFFSHVTLLFCFGGMMVEKAKRTQSLDCWVSQGLLHIEISCGPYAALENEKRSNSEAADVPLDGLCFFAVRGPLCWHETFGYIINKTRLLERRESRLPLVSPAEQALVTCRDAGTSHVVLGGISFWSKASLCPIPRPPKWQLLRWSLAVEVTVRGVRGATFMPHSCQQRPFLLLCPLRSSLCRSKKPANRRLSSNRCSTSLSLWRPVVLSWGWFWPPPPADLPKYSKGSPPDSDLGFPAPAHTLSVLSGCPWLWDEFMEKFWKRSVPAAHSSLPVSWVPVTYSKWRLGKALLSSVNFRHRGIHSLYLLNLIFPGNVNKFAPFQGVLSPLASVMLVVIVLELYGGEVTWEETGLYWLHPLFLTLRASFPPWLGSKGPSNADSHRLPFALLSPLTWSKPDLPPPLPVTLTVLEALSPHCQGQPAVQDGEREAELNIPHLAPWTPVMKQLTEPSSLWTRHCAEGWTFMPPDETGTNELNSQLRKVGWREVKWLT